MTKYGGIPGDTNIETPDVIEQLPPDVYDDAILESVEFKNATKQDGSAGKEIIEFIFSHKSGKHQHAEWKIDENDPKADNKIQNEFKRICHILRLFLSEKHLKAFMEREYDDFEAMANTVVKAIGEKTGSKSPKLRIKIVGSVYNDQRRSGFPGYLGFIGKSGDEKIKFSPNEERGNTEYWNFVPPGNTASDYESDDSDYDDPEEGKQESGGEDDIPF